jgi:hypothetical protein
MTQRPDRPNTPVVTRSASTRRIWPRALLLLVAALLLLRWYSLRQTEETGASHVVEPRGEGITTSGQPPAEIAVTDAAQPTATDAIAMAVVIGGHFQPVNFRMAAVSQHIRLGDTSSPQIKRFPMFRSNQQRYGELRFANGVVMPMVLDTAIDGYRLYVDRNLNGDLRDDGPGLTNQGNGLFAASLLLSMPLVSGRQDLGQDYLLWIYTGNKERPPASINRYVRTQLQGRIELAGGSYDAYLADNRHLDGDFRNDGIAIDLDADGRIDLQEEYFPPGRDALINDRRYRFSINY